MMCPLNCTRRTCNLKSKRRGSIMEEKDNHKSNAQQPEAEQSLIGALFVDSRALS